MADLITGMIKARPVDSVPVGWLNCDGSAVSRTTYATLFAVIGTSYGVGDGSTTFNLPDIRGRSIVGQGQGASLTNRNLGDTGGEETHALTEGEMASHLHNGNSGNVGNHSHSIYRGNSGGDGNDYAQVNNADTNSNTGGGGSHSHSMSLANTGSGTAHNNMQPFLAVKYMIKT